MRTGKERLGSAEEFRRQILPAGSLDDSESARRKTEFSEAEPKFLVHDRNFHRVKGLGFSDLRAGDNFVERIIRMKKDALKFNDTVCREIITLFDPVSRQIFVRRNAIFWIVQTHEE